MTHLNYPSLDAVQEMTDWDRGGNMLGADPQPVPIRRPDPGFPGSAGQHRRRGHSMQAPHPRRRGFTLLEVMIAVAIIAIAMTSSIATIQMGRVHARAVSLEVIGQNLAVAMTELVKRSGYTEIAYGQDLPSILGTASSINPLLELPRQSGSSSGSTLTVLPAGPPGGVTNLVMEDFLQDWRDGTIDFSSSVVSGSTNYLYFSDDQIAALSGYEDADSVPEGVSVLDAQFAWGVYVTTDAAGGSGGAIGYPIKHLAIVVKWDDPRRASTQYVVVESYVSQVSPRL
jgi:prepilin-type N-terminal cleavage/methylation domain-containing protein